MNAFSIKVCLVILLLDNNQSPFVRNGQRNLELFCIYFTMVIYFINKNVLSVPLKRKCYYTRRHMNAMNQKT